MLVSQESPPWLAEWPAAKAAIHRFARGRLPVGVEPDDVSQQVVLKLLAAGSGAPPADRVKFWALRVARNVVADLYRAKTLHSSDLPAPAAPDVESIAFARLRCEAAAQAYGTLSAADRHALADPRGRSEPLANKTKLRRSRARRAMRDRAERTVGAGFIVRRLKWLLGPSGAAAIVVPFCVGIAPAVTDPGQASEPRIEPVVIPEHHARAEEPVVVDPPATARIVSGPVPSEREQATTRYYRQASIDVVEEGPTGYDNYDPPPGEPDPALACARNLRVSEDVCVDHPLR